MTHYRILDPYRGEDDDARLNFVQWELISDRTGRSRERAKEGVVRSAILLALGSLAIGVAIFIGFVLPTVCTVAALLGVHSTYSVKRVRKSLALEEERDKLIDRRSVLVDARVKHVFRTMTADLRRLERPFRLELKPLWEEALATAAAVDITASEGEVAEALTRVRARASMINSIASQRAQLESAAEKDRLALEAKLRTPATFNGDDDLVSADQMLESLKEGQRRLASLTKELLP